MIKNSNILEKQADTKRIELAEIEISIPNFETGTDKEEIRRIHQELDLVNSQLEGYMNRADRVDYSFAVASGILAGIVDSILTPELSLSSASSLGDEKVKEFVVRISKGQGYSGDSLPGAVQFLENKYPLAADKLTNQFGGGLQHHLRDFSHHPTPVGLLCSILTQFTGEVYGTNTQGEFQSYPLPEEGRKLMGKEPPEKILLGIMNWIFHLISDMAGSSGSVLKGSYGTGLPGPLVSLLKEISTLPLFSNMDANGNREFSVWISKLFNGTLLGTKDENGTFNPVKIDFRTEFGLGSQLLGQAFPVLLNECMVRSFFFLKQFKSEVSAIKRIEDIGKVNIQNCLPFRNRTLDRMIAVSSMTLMVTDTADAAVHAAVESCGNWVLFSGRMIARLNYIGALRASVAIIKEVTNEAQEAQLIHEKMLLCTERSEFYFERLQDFKAELEEKVSSFLEEDITAFLEGFDDMQTGQKLGDSDLFIHGNVTIQKALGSQPQFSNLKEFDEMMNSDAPLKLGGGVNAD